MPERGRRNPRNGWALSYVLLSVFSLSVRHCSALILDFIIEPFAEAFSPVFGLFPTGTIIEQLS